MTVRTQKRFLLALGAVAAAGLAVPAQAQSAGGGFDKPLSAAPRASQPGRSTTMMRQQDGDQVYELRIADGKVTAKVNGKEVPANRIVKEEDGIKLLDQDGNVIQRFSIVVGDGHAVVGGVPAIPAVPGALGWDDGQPLMEEARPKVMLGINMAAPSEALNRNYGLEPGQAILIDRVLDGLAADRAGIRENDIITEIDGKKPASPETLWEALKDKEPGDTVTFTVLRKGGNRAIRVKLDAYDADKLAPLMTGPGVGGAGPQDLGDVNMAGREAERMLEELRKSGKAWTRIPGVEGNVMTIRPDVFVAPRVGDRMADMDRRMSELDEKLTRLSEQMAKIEAMMDKLAKQRD